jgi:NADPH2:quinone reductase
MRAWLMDSYAGADTLRLEQVPDPVPRPDEVLLNIRLAALNPADAFLASGQYPAKPRLPHILGRDGIGDVAVVGSSVRGVRAGDLVGILRCDIGVERWGTLAEKVVVPGESLTPIPQGWTPEEMAGAPLVFLTAWQALTQWTEPPAPPPPGSKVLVTGASGGVGVASVLLGKSMGLTILALSRSAEKRSTLKALGADFAFDPNQADVAEAILTNNGTTKIHLMIDTVGGPLLSQLLKVLGYGGRVSVVGRSGGPVPQFNTAALLFRRIRIGGVAVGDYSAAEAQATWKQIVQRLNGIAQRPVIDCIVPFEKVKEGFARLAQGPMGKVLVRVQSTPTRLNGGSR